MTNTGCESDPTVPTTPHTSCKYELAPGCACVPGSCVNGQICTCGTNDVGEIISSQLVACPAKFPQCDPKQGRCVCVPGPASCADDATRTYCDKSGDWISERCGDHHACKNGTCVCVPNCDGRECGPDGCGGRCGTIASPKSCPCPSGSCGGISTCDASGHWTACSCTRQACPAGWVTGTLQGTPDPNGAYCVFNRSDGRRDFTISGDVGTVIDASAIPAECRGLPCAVRAVFESQPRCTVNPNQAALTFRCDGDSHTEVSLLLKFILEDNPGTGGPQFPCRDRLELVKDVFGDGCQVHIKDMSWTGGMLGACSR